MYLLIDVGNTRIKWILQKEASSDLSAVNHGDLNQLKQFIASINTSEVSVLVAAVNQSIELKHLLNSFPFNAVSYARSQEKQFGVVNSYSQPQRMGVDRWLAMIASYDLAQISAEQRGVITVDAGSALTIDVVSKNGNHLGGYIVPGLQMSQQALFANTEQVIKYDEALQAVAQNDKLAKLGNNTLECVEYGVITQMVALIQAVANQYPDYQLVITGGDSEMLAQFFPAAKIESDLVFKGLWQVRD